MPGTPLAHARDLDPFDFVRTIAVARIMMPRAQVRLSAGREQMSDELQALAFLAGANSIFYGEKLLTTGNPDVEHDRALLARLGTQPEGRRRGCRPSAASRARVAAAAMSAARTSTALTRVRTCAATSLDRHLQLDARAQRRECVDRCLSAARRRHAVRIDGRVLRNFCSNDYLGLASIRS